MNTGLCSYNIIMNTVNDMKIYKAYAFHNKVEKE